MKAAVHRRFGSSDVVTVDDVPTPVPQDDEVLCYSLRRIVDAHRRVDEGRKKGNIIITMMDLRVPGP